MAEVCLAVCSNIVEGAKSLFKPIIRQISYVFKYQSYIDELKKQEKLLGFKRERVGKATEEATRQEENMYGDVRDWLNSVDAFSEDVAKPIIDDEDGAKKSCFKGLCPNLLSRYKLSKRAAKAAKDAADLVRKGNFSKVSYRPPPKSSVLRDVTDYEAFDSRKKLFQDVVEALKDDKLNIIGVYGMGGVGKTTLVKQVAKQVMEDKLFDKVVMAEVTQTPDRNKIQDKFAFDLGMKFESNESIGDRADRLRRRLKEEKRVLIILDNIWTELELDAIGIPSGDVDKEREDDQRRRTIILTSRQHDLLEKHMNSTRNFKINVLSKTEALQLFEKIVGDSTKISAFQRIADEIVERCGGLPVALITLAKALRNERRRETWEYVLYQLSRFGAKEIRGMESNVYISIKLSYDLLGSERAKSLFLLCGLFSEGHAIPVPSLLRYGMGMGYFGNINTLKEARESMRRLIDILKSSCLLLDGDAEDEVKMHDFIRVVAVSIAEEELMFNIPNVDNVKKKMEETMQESPIAISLPYRDIQVLPERLQCPLLKLFLLFTEGECSMQVSDHFFEGTEGLKVLDFTGIHFSSLPSSLGRLVNLQTLCLDGCRLKDIVMVGQLKKLEILSLRDSEIKQLPHEIGQLTQLQLLDLSNCGSLEVIAPNVISKLCQLEELYMSNSFCQWEKVEGGSNASLVELKGLSKLTTLEIHVRDADILPQDWVSVELQRYRICIGEVWGSWSVKSETSRLMKLHGLENVSILLENYRMKLLRQRTEDLDLQELKGIQNVDRDLDDGEGFPQLKHLHVKYCSEILHIVGSVERVRCNKVFPLLESLSLSNLINLETICDSQLTEDQFFSNLKIIKVASSEKLKHLFSFSIAKNLLRLQNIKVVHCNELKTIVGTDMEKATSEGSKEIIAEDDPNQKVIFPSLEELELGYLEKIEKLWPNPFPNNLTKVTVDYCHPLKYLFSYSMVNSLLQLEHLKIVSCESMEGIFDASGLGRDEGKLIELMVFPKLRSLQLERLPELTSFVNTIHIHSDSVVELISKSSLEGNIRAEMQPQSLFDEKVRFPSLEELFIEKMDKLRKIWHDQLASESFSKLKKLRIESCNDIMNIFPPSVIFPSLEELELRWLSNIEKFWPDQFPNNLTKVTVGSCGRLKYLFSYSMVNSLLQLEHLAIIDCESMEGIFDASGLGRDEGKLIELMVFPKLRSLLLMWLPKLTSFVNTIHIHSDSVVEFISKSSLKDNIRAEMQPQPLFDKKVRFPNLEELSISGMYKLRKVWHHQLASESFSKLKKLHIEKCNDIMNIFPPWVGIPSSLVNLEVSHCEKIEEIIGHVEEEVKENRFVFNELKHLELDDLRRLTSFCLEDFTLEFPSLERVSITRCLNMKTFSQGNLSTPKLDKVHMNKKGLNELSQWEVNELCYWEGDLNSTMQKYYEEMVAFKYNEEAISN